MAAKLRLDLGLQGREWQRRMRRRDCGYASAIAAMDTFNPEMRAGSLAP
jgi:hypothetical protein